MCTLDTRSVSLTCRRWNCSGVKRGETQRRGPKGRDKLRRGLWISRGLPIKLLVEGVLSDRTTGVNLPVVWSEICCVTREHRESTVEGRRRLILKTSVPETVQVESVVHIPKYE